MNHIVGARRFAQSDDNLSDSFFLTLINAYILSFPSIPSCLIVVFQRWIKNGVRTYDVRETHLCQSHSLDVIDRHL